MKMNLPARSGWETGKHRANPPKEEDLQQGHERKKRGTVNTVRSVIQKQSDLDGVETKRVGASCSRPPKPAQPRRKSMEALEEPPGNDPVSVALHHSWSLENIVSAHKVTCRCPAVALCSLWLRPQQCGRVSPLGAHVGPWWGQQQSQSLQESQDAHYAWCQLHSPRPLTGFSFCAKADNSRESRVPAIMCTCHQKLG